MSDLFHEGIPDDYVFRVFEVMAEASRHQFQVLTKRHNRLRDLARSLAWPNNVWIGVTIENDRWVERADVLRTIPAAVRFISAEPLLGPLPNLQLNGIDWLIAGGESGPGRRYAREEWVRDLRDRCDADGVAFFFKQWGGRYPKAGGRLLDGSYWDEYPTPRRRSQVPEAGQPRLVSPIDGLLPEIDAARMP
jgi:protein gp37